MAVSEFQFEYNLSACKWALIAIHPENLFGRNIRVHETEHWIWLVDDSKLEISIAFSNLAGKNATSERYECCKHITNS